jgi:putative membrane protein
MKHDLNEPDKAALEKHIREAEVQTGAQIVLAVIKRSDSYAELPWKAFAFGVSVASLAVLSVYMFSSFWITDMTILLSLFGILVSGIFIASLTLVFPGIARLFLAKHRRETESLQYTDSVFLSHELFSSADRRGVLLLISRFERQVVILPDKGVKSHLSDGVIKDIISEMRKHLRDNDLRRALETGLEKLIEAIDKPLGPYTGENELPDQIIEEEGL